MKHTEDELKLLNNLRNMFVLGKRFLEDNSELHSFNLKQKYLIYIFSAVHSYSQAVFILCEKHESLATNVILRSLIEAHLNTLIILDDDTDDNLLKFLFDQELENQKTRNDLAKADISQSLKNELRSEISNIAIEETKLIEDAKKLFNIECKNYNELKSEFKKLYGHNILVRIGKIRDNYKRTIANEQYVLIYRHLSQYSHLNISNIQELDEINNSSSKGIRKEIVTVSYVYLEFLKNLQGSELLSQNISLNKFEILNGSTSQS